MATIYCPYGTSAYWYQTAAYYGAVGYTSTYVATNGDKKAALTGAISGAVFNGIGSYFSYVQGSGQLSSGMMAAKVAAHGVVGGLSARANGGKFESGFLSAGLSQAAGQYGLYDSLGAVENAQGWNIAYNAGVSAVVGGSISELSGGSFEEGALTAAMGRLFNDLSHLQKQFIRSTFIAGGTGAGGVGGAVALGGGCGLVTAGGGAVPCGYAGVALGGAAGAIAGGYLAEVYIGAVDGFDHWYSDNSKRFTSEQQTLIEIAKEAKAHGGLSYDDAKALVELGQEAGFGRRARGPEKHLDRPGAGKHDHIHLGPVNHIPVNGASK